MKDKLIIIGASGHGKVVADIAVKLDKWKKILFADDDDKIKECIGFEVLGKIGDVLKYKMEADFFIAIGNNGKREKIQEKLIQEGLIVSTLIHPSAIIGKDVEIDIGTVVMAGVVINSSSKIGKGCIINTSVSIDHDNEIGDYVHISPGANLAGTVKIGKRTWIGIGSVISNNVSISSDCILGAGSVVIKDLPPNCTAVGSPARPIKFH